MQEDPNRLLHAHDKILALHDLRLSTLESGIHRLEEKMDSYQEKVMAKLEVLDTRIHESRDRQTGDTISSLKGSRAMIFTILLVILNSAWDVISRLLKGGA